MKNNFASIGHSTIPARTRAREEREAVAGIAANGTLDTDIAVRFLPRHDSFLLVIPHGNGTSNYTSSALSIEAAEKMAEFLLDNLPDAEEVPSVRRLIEHLRWEMHGEIARMEGEIQTLRWRVLHLEREAEKPLAPYSDATALVLRKERAA